MAENLTGTVCSLGGDALVIGGSGFIAYGVLKAIGGVSTTLSSMLEYMPTVFKDPDVIWRDMKNMSGESGSRRNWLSATVVNYGTKTILVVGTIGGGIMLKKMGGVVKSDAFIETISRITKSN